MEVLELVDLLIFYLVIGVIVATITLVALQVIVNMANLNPFTRTALTVRRLSDPIIQPVRRGLMSFGMEPKLAPFITILIVILLGWFAFTLSSTVLNTLAGVWLSLMRGAFVALMGYVLYGVLGLYALLIFIRIIFSWGMLRYTNPLMRFLVNATEPLLAPLRRIIPPLGMFDISPIVAFIIIWIFQAAVAGTLLRGLPLGFFG